MEEFSSMSSPDRGDIDIVVVSDGRWGLTSTAGKAAGLRARAIGFIIVASRLISALLDEYTWDTHVAWGSTIGTFVR